MVCSIWKCYSLQIIPCRIFFFSFVKEGSSNEALHYYFNNAQSAKLSCILIVDSHWWNRKRQNLSGGDLYRHKSLQLSSTSVYIWVSGRKDSGEEGNQHLLNLDGDRKSGLCWLTDKVMWLNNNLKAWIIHVHFKVKGSNLVISSCCSISLRQEMLF